MTVAVRECVILQLGIGVFAWPPSCALSTVQSLTSALIVTRPGEQWWISLEVLLERAFTVGGLGALSPFGSSRDATPFETPCHIGGIKIE